MTKRRADDAFVQNEDGKDDDGGGGGGKRAKVDLERVYIAFDIESAGCEFENPILQIGVAYGTDAKHLETKSWCFDHPDGPFEERCAREFWSKFPDILERIRKEAKASGRTVDEQWADFAGFMSHMYQLCQDKLVIVSDNPAFDVSMIDQQLRLRKLKSSGIRYSPLPNPGTYLPVHDPTERIKGLGSAKEAAIRAEVEKQVKHTHWAEDDAQGILLLEFAVAESIRNLV